MFYNSTLYGFVSKIPTKRENKFRKIFEKREGFIFVMPVTGLNKTNTGKEDDDETSLFGCYRHKGNEQTVNSYQT
jgi:hypothetical protein